MSQIPSTNASLLDQFAMAALTGLLASEAVSNGCGSEYISYSKEAAATRAYAIAEAMMKERNKRQLLSDKS